MKAPIIVVEHGDIMVYESLVKAQIGLEPIDVENGEYVGYDGDGRMLRLSLSRKEKPSFFGRSKSVDCVEITYDQNCDDHTSDLRNALLGFFKATGRYDPRDESSALKDLISKAVEQYGYT